MKNLLILSLTLATSLTCAAQSGNYANTQPYDRIGHGEDSLTVLQENTLYRTAYKEQNWAEAYKHWKIVLEKAPLFQSRIYTEGISILWQLYAQATDEAKKQEYFEMMMKVYDQRLQNLDDLNSFATKKTYTTRGNILTRKANDYYTYAPQTADKNEIAYKMFKQGIDDMGENEVHGYVLYNFITCSYSRYLENKEANREDFINDYLETNETCERLLELSKQYSFTDSIATEEDSIKAAELEKKAAKIVAQYQPTQIQCENLFNASGAANCADLDRIYANKVEANISDIEYLKKVLGVISNFDCDESELYNKIVKVVYPRSAKEDADKGTTAKKNTANKFVYYQEEFNNETSASRKAKIACSLAALYYRAGQIGSCRQWCSKALAVDKTCGNAYLMIASCIVRQASGSGLERSKYYCLAIDKCNRAKAVDPSCASKASSQIANYRNGLYPKSEAFFAGIKEGQKVTVLGEATTLRFR